MKILVLYEELALYFLNCINVLAEFKESKILIFCKKVNPVAPFEFNSIHPNVIIKDRDVFSDEGLLSEVKKFSPDYIFLGGWSNKKYITVIRQIHVKKTIIAFDNRWENTWRQKLGSVYFRLKLKPYIHRAFVPGNPQKLFAEKIGFTESDIIPGVYCCDFGFFNSVYKRFRTEKLEQFPKRFLFVGRYAREKGVDDLWDAFIELQNESPSEWELWCLGAGNIKKAEHKKIRHFGFVQPAQMDEIVRQTGVFVLPSHFEPWGVVVHEYAAAGFPLICSDKVGSAEKFLAENENGYLFKAGDKEQLKQKMKLFMNISNEKLNLMTEKSNLIASTLKPEDWARNLLNGFLS